MPAVKVNRMRMGTLVHERHAHAIPFRGTESRTGHLAVIGPRGEKDPGRNLDFTVDRDELVLAQQGTVGPRRLVIELSSAVVREIGKIPRAESP